MCAQINMPSRRFLVQQACLNALTWGKMHGALLCGLDGWLPQTEVEAVRREFRSLAKYMEEQRG